MSAAKRLLVAASGTGGHVFPAIAIAEQLSDYEIEWLGVPDRLESRLVSGQYRLHTIAVEGFQQKLGFNTVRILGKFARSIQQVRQLLHQGKFQGVLTTGGYIAAPAIIAARSLGLPTLLHESNALPGKVTRWLSPWCSRVAVGFEAAISYLPRGQTVYTGTPVRSQFLAGATQDIPGLDIPLDVPLITIVGGSQGAVAVNKLVRESAPAWVESGAWLVHLTGENDPEAQSFQHPHYLTLPFYDHMAPLLHRSTLAISRAGAGTLTELAIVGTPAILIPYPFAAEDHQTYNAQVFAKAGAAQVFPQDTLTSAMLTSQVLEWLRSPATLAEVAQNAKVLAVPDSADRLAKLVRLLLAST